jgi:hypothetical protein
VVYSFVSAGTNLFATTSDGVFLTADNGANWTQASTGITGQNVVSLGVSGNSILAGTVGGGVFISPL